MGLFLLIYPATMEVVIIATEQAISRHGRGLVSQIWYSGQSDGHGLDLVLSDGRLVLV